MSSASVTPPSDIITETTTSQSETAAMSHTWQPRGAVDLPIVGTKGAPKKFKGQASDVYSFIRHYEKLCDKCNVTSDQEKIENITQYCSRSVREFLEGLSSYAEDSWSGFKKDFKEFFNADRDERRFRIRDLEKYCSQNRHAGPIKDLAAWRKYNRGFIRIAGWLENKGKLTKDEYNTYFWLGIPHKLRDRLEHRLMSQNPTHDISTPFEAEKIKKVAKTLLQTDRFDRERLPSDDEDSDDEDQETESSSSESDSDSDASDSDAPIKRHKSSREKKKKSSGRKVRTRFSSRSASDSEEEDKGKKTPKEDQAKKKPSSSVDDEVEELINKLNRMSVNDPAYAGMYFRACRLSPLVQQIIPSPVSVKERQNYGMPLGNNGRREAPPHFERRPYDPSRSFRCYGCGKEGHTKPECPALHELMKKKIVKKTASGRWTMSNGELIIQAVGETTVDAAKRLHAARANFVALQAAHMQSDISDIDDDYDQAYTAISPMYYVNGGAKFSDNEEDYEVYAAERPGRTIRNFRQEKFDGVWVPARKKQQQEKKGGVKAEKENQTPQATKRSGQQPTPIEVHKPILVNPDDSDAFMEDNFGPRPKPSKPIAARKDASVPTKASAEARNGDKEPAKEKQARISDLQSRTNVQGVLQKVLKAPITIEIGEILGVSKEMSHQVQEALRPKVQIPRPMAKAYASSNPLSNTMVAAASFVPRTRGTLIQLLMECDGKPINAIIDTGSQLNIAHRAAWKGAIRRPMDITQHITMGDANGGEGTLTGFVPNIPLRCGDVVTRASVFVGDKAPFDLLLGRPWQRGNYVSIDERIDGTYLLFKDQSMTVQYEILVTPEHVCKYNPEITEYLAQLGALQNFAVTVEEEMTTGSISDDEASVAEEEIGKSRILQDQDIQALTSKLEQLYAEQENRNEEDKGFRDKGKAVDRSLAQPSYDKHLLTKDPQGSKCTQAEVGGPTAEMEVEGENHDKNDLLHASTTTSTSYYTPSAEETEDLRSREAPNYEAPVARVYSVFEKPTERNGGIPEPGTEEFLLSEVRQEQMEEDWGRYTHLPPLEDVMRGWNDLSWAQDLGVPSIEGSGIVENAEEIRVPVSQDDEAPKAEEDVPGELDSSVLNDRPLEVDWGPGMQRIDRLYVWPSIRDANRSRKEKKRTETKRCECCGRFLGRENGCDQASGSQVHEAPAEALQTGYLDFPEEREKELVTDGREKPPKLTWSGRKLWKDENLGPQA